MQISELYLLLRKTNNRICKSLYRFIKIPEIENILKSISVEEFLSDISDFKELTRDCKYYLISQKIDSEIKNDLAA